jgi:hypothetical protein
LCRVCSDDGPGPRLGGKWASEDAVAADEAAGPFVVWIRVTLPLDFGADVKSRLLSGKVVRSIVSGRASRSSIWRRSCESN